MPSLSWIFKLLPVGLLALETSGLAVDPAQNGMQPSNAAAKPPLPANIVYKFDNGTWPENKRFRKNGELLVTTSTAARLYSIDPSKNQSGGLLHQFPKEKYNCTFGIVELEDDVFYVAAGKWITDDEYVGLKGSWSIFQVDFNKRPGGKPKIRKATDVPVAQMLDGLGVINREKGYLVGADANQGAIVLIDVYKKTSRILIQDPLLKGKDPEPGLTAFGINGLKVRNGTIYFTNQSKAVLGKLVVDAETGTVPPGGKIDVIGTYPGKLLDDFNIRDGIIYNTAVESGIYKVNPNMGQNFRGPLVELEGVNTVTFGVLPGDQTTTYISRAVFDPTGIYKVEGLIDA